MDIVDEIIGAVVAAGKDGIKVFELCTALKLGPKEIIRVLRPREDKVEITFNADGEMILSERDRRTSASNILVLPPEQPEYVKPPTLDDDTKLSSSYGEDTILIDRKAPMMKLHLNIDEVGGLIELLSLPAISSFLTESQRLHLLRRLSEAMPERFARILPEVQAETDLDRVRFANSMKIITSAFIEGRAVRIIYMSEDSKLTNRTIFPLAIIGVKNGLLVQAYCYLRGEYRGFRLDRIVSAVVVEAPVAEDVPPSPYF
ncbi:MAG: WYL domain-containing protein [Arcanobacterium sp.]|nr:WYL domain-containing protein [Arcanobacterium sp.]